MEWQEDEEYDEADGEEGQLEGAPWTCDKPIVLDQILFFLVAEDNTALIVVGSVMCVTTEIDLAVMILKILWFWMPQHKYFLY